jgi:hypothetical protein
MKVILTVLISIVSFPCFSQMNAVELVSKINMILNENPSDGGYYCTAALKNDKLVVNYYSPKNKLNAKYEAYVTDLDRIATSTDFSTIQLKCEGQNKCIKGISTNYYNMRFDDARKWIDAIDEAKIDPRYINTMEVSFMPDSRVCKSLKELLAELRLLYQ